LRKDQILAGIGRLLTLSEFSDQPKFFWLSLMGGYLLIWKHLIWQLEHIRSDFAAKWVHLCPHFTDLQLGFLWL